MECTLGNERTWLDVVSMSFTKGLKLTVGGALAAIV